MPKSNFLSFLNKEDKARYAYFQDDLNYAINFERHSITKVSMYPYTLPLAPLEAPCRCLQEHTAENRSSKLRSVERSVKGWMLKNLKKLKKIQKLLFGHSEINKIETGVIVGPDVKREIRPYISNLMGKGIEFNNLPAEIKKMIWEYALTPDTDRVHELIHHSKQAQLPERHHNRMFLRSTNAYIPNILHVSREWRAEALEFYHVCEYKPAVPHPPEWKSTHTCVTIKPFYFYKNDTLYLPQPVAEWLGYVWARHDALWVKNLFAGWRNVGIDFRAPSWVGRTPSCPLIATVFEKTPATPFHTIFPSLKKLSIVIDLSREYSPAPTENNSYLEDTLHIASSQLASTSLVVLWGLFMDLEYMHDPMSKPLLQFQAIHRQVGVLATADEWFRSQLGRVRN